jgi:hypothetical protein
MPYTPMQLLCGLPVPAALVGRLAARLAPAPIVLAVVCAATVRDYVHAEQAGPAMQDQSRAVGDLPYKPLSKPQTLTS